MSNWFSSILEQLSWISWSNHRGPFEVVILGLEDTGKTSFLNKIKQQQQSIEVTIPTISFVIECLEVRGIYFRSWDIGGSTKLRSLWFHYFKTMQMLIFVIDSTDCDNDRINSAREELHKLVFIDEMRDKPLLVLANKQDLPGAMTLQELSKQYQLAGLIRTHIWFMQKTSMVTRDGINEAISWIEDYKRRRR